MKTSSILSGLLCGLCAISLQGCGSDSSPRVEEWPVEGKLVGPAKDGDRPKKSHDISGIACDRESGFPRRCLVIDDETQAAQAVTVYDGRIVVGGVVPLISDAFDGRPLELDGEGVAFADGAFFVMGSHGHPRDRKHRLDEQDDAPEIRAKITASSKVLRLTLRDNAWDDDERDAEAATVEASSRLRDAIKSVAELAPFVDRRLDQSGLTIEGVAVARGRLYAGLRSPVPDGKAAVVVDVKLGAIYGRDALDPQTHRLDLGGRGVRDIVAYKGAFLVLAGPSLDEPGAFAVYSWDGAGAAKLIGPVPDFADDEKPEAILPLDETDRALRLLVLFDGAKEGGPRAITLSR